MNDHRIALRSKSASVAIALRGVTRTAQTMPTDLRRFAPNLRLGGRLRLGALGERLPIRRPIAGDGAGPGRSRHRHHPVYGERLDNERGGKTKDRKTTHLSPDSLDDVLIIVRYAVAR
jgi:hypothetical protein